MDRYPKGGGGKKKDDLFATAKNPMAKKSAGVQDRKVRQYAMPDPSKKTMTGDNVPIKINKKG